MRDRDRHEKSTPLVLCHAEPSRRCRRRSSLSLQAPEHPVQANAYHRRLWNTSKPSRVHLPHDRHTNRYEHGFEGSSTPANLICPTGDG
jgi:hypothetical protein